MQWILISLISFGTLKSQTGVSSEAYERPDSVMNAFLKRWNIKGASVAVTREGKLVYNRAFGFTNNEGTKLAKPHDLFRIASVSKPITAIAIMKLVEEGKLKLTDKVFGKGKILDELYYLDVIKDQRVYAITVEQLLQHSAGWDRKNNYLNFQSCDPPFFPLLVTELEEAPNPVGDSTLIRFSLKKGLDSDPGTTYSYSNIGFLILGKVIEKASGQKYERYIEKNVFEPLSIADIHLGKNLLEARQERETEYINNQNTFSCYGTGSIVPWQYGGFNIEAMNAHGGWIASASELTKLLLAVDGFSTSPDILSPSSILNMTSPSPTNNKYAKGWAINAKNNWWHTGSLEGTSAVVCRTSTGYTFAFLFNSRSDNSNEFWQALDRLPWEILTSARAFPKFNLFPPSKNVSDLSARFIAEGTASITWKKGSGDGRLVVMSEDPTLEDFPEDGISYIGETEYGKGSALGKNCFVVYNSFGRNTVVTNLDPHKAYYVTAFEYYINPSTGFYEVYKLGARERILLQDSNSGSEVQ
jgi:CubicO group peptidase (beta-lactamase class C family)